MAALLYLSITAAILFTVFNLGETLPKIIMVFKNQTDLNSTRQSNTRQGGWVTQTGATHDKPVPETKNEYLIPNGTCIENCIHENTVLVGNFQSCKGCEIYATCAQKGKFFDKRPCQRNYWNRPPFIWDDNLKKCVENSTTCFTRKEKITVPVGTCITSCIKPNSTDQLVGDFQSCQGCEVYATCIPDGRFFDKRPCPANHAGRPTFIWDDKEKKCVENSTTCFTRKTVVPETKAEEKRIVPIGKCVDKCVFEGKNISGDFQSCLGCHVYATCDPYGKFYDNRTCQLNYPGLKKFVWDDEKKRCGSSSATCKSP